MSTQTKSYVIEIQLDNAKQQLDDTTKKLAALDKQLEGLDRGSDAAKEIVAEMARLAKQVESSENNVEQLSGRLDGLKPGTIGALRQEFIELKAALDLTVEGSEEANAVLQRMGEVKGEIKGLKDEVKALDPEQRINAFNNFAQGVVGAFGIATVAAETFGLSSTAAEEFTKKTQGVIAVLSSLEGIRNALDGETLKSIKSTLQLGKAYITAGEGASTGSKVTKAALISTGIGAIIVLVGILIANWDRLTASVKGSEAFFTKVKAITSGLFDSAIASLGLFADMTKDLFTLQFSKLAADAESAGQRLGDAYDKGYRESLAESNRKVIEQQIAAQARLIEVLKAKGVETFALEEGNLLAKLQQQKRGTDAEKQQYLDLAKELDVLRATHGKKEREDAEALTLARLSGVLSLEQAKGQESYQAQLAVEQQKLAALKAAATPQLAAIEAQENAITSLIAAKVKERADKKRALQFADLQAQLIVRTAQGGDEYQLALDQNAIQEKIADLHLKTLREAAQVDAAQVLLANAEVFRIKQERLAIQYKEEERLDDEHKKTLKTNAEAEMVRALEREKRYQADLLIVKAGAARVNEQLSAEIAEKARIAALAPNTLGDNILVRVFGLGADQIDATKARINQGFSQLSETLTATLNTALTQGLSAADAAITDAQTRLSELDQQLSESSSKRQSDEQALTTATGARRDFLLTRISKEVAEEERLRSAKARAARDEAAAAKQKAQLQKEQNQISAASTAIEAVLLGIKAAQTLVDIADKGKFGFDNIVLALAAAATLGAGIYAMKNAASSFADGTGALGSDGVLQGPSHKGGGIALFSRSGHFYGEAEGGEAITPTDATRKNAKALELIRTVGRTRTLSAADFMAQEAANVRVLPPTPTAHYANGTGSLGGASSLPAGAVVVQSADLAELVETNKQMLAQLGMVANHTAITAAKPPIGREGALELRAMANEVDAAANMAKL